MLFQKNIIVVGSVNIDMVVMTKRFPVPGETLLADKYFVNLGGKGANQSVAAARLGGSVSLICKLGNDQFGDLALKQLSQENIDVSMVSKDNRAHSGIALITVDAKAENTIVVASGANALFTFDDLIDMKTDIDFNSIVLMQLEIPIDTIYQVAKYAKSRQATVILNPAPAQILSADFFQNIDILTPNQAEAKLLSGVEVFDTNSAFEASKYISNLGPKVVIITMGDKGAYVYKDNKGYMVSGHNVNAIDTTAAGDVFNGSLAVGLSKGQSIEDAVLFATKAAAFSVTKVGAQSSAPTIEDIKNFFTN